MVQDNAIYIVPASLQEANDYLAEHIRRCQPMRGCKFSVGCALDGELVGAAIVGRCRDDAQAVQIDRIYTTGGRAAYGMLYGAAARAAQALGKWTPPCALRDGSVPTLWIPTGSGHRKPCAMNGC